MKTSPAPAATERLRVGGPLRVLLVADPPSLLLRMNEVVRSTAGVQLAGGFSTALDTVEWLLWDRAGWHYAFVDLALPENGTRDVVQRLLSGPKPGSVVALGPHLWQETRASCAQMGMYHLLEKGDLIAFRGFLEEKAR